LIACLFELEILSCMRERVRNMLFSPKRAALA